MQLLSIAATFLYYMALKDKGPIYILAPNITEILLRSAQILSEDVVVLDFLAVDNFDFMRKIVKKFWMKN